MSIPNIPNTQGACRARPAAEGAQDLPGGSAEPGPPAPGPAPALQAPHDGPAARARSVRLAAGPAGLAPRSSLRGLPRRSGAEEVRQGRPHAAAVPPQRRPFAPPPSLPSSSHAVLPAPQGGPLAAPQDMPLPSLHALGRLSMEMSNHVPPQVRSVLTAMAPLLRSLADLAFRLALAGLPVRWTAVTGTPAPLSLGGQDQRSREEIERTGVLHRPGPNLGPGDLPALRASLGQLGTPEQQERALSYAPLLGEAVTQARMYLDLAPGDTRRNESLEALRTSAGHIQERAEDDYEQDCIMGADFHSITQYLAILFRAVDG